MKASAASAWKYAAVQAKPDGPMPVIYRYRFVTDPVPRNEAERLLHGVWSQVVGDLSSATLASRVSSTPPARPVAPMLLSGKQLMDALALGKCKELGSSEWWEGGDTPRAVRSVRLYALAPASAVPELAKRIWKEVRFFSKVEYQVGNLQWWCVDTSSLDSSGAFYHYAPFSAGFSIEAAAAKRFDEMVDGEKTSIGSGCLVLTVGPTSWQDDIVKNVAQAAEMAVQEEARKAKEKADREREARERIAKGITTGLDNSDFAKAFQARFGKKR